MLSEELLKDNFSAILTADRESTMDRQNGKLILLRHGESDWNGKNLFTGWVDVSLSPLGVQQALDAGKKLAEIPLDEIHTSTLTRAWMTALLAMSLYKGGKTPLLLTRTGGAAIDAHAGWDRCYSEETIKDSIPVLLAWELNERMYGELQGLNKDEARKQFGKEQVEIWRRSYRKAPPGGESLAMTAERTLPHFLKNILPRVEEGRALLVAAHGNSLRAIVMHLKKLSEDEVVHLEIPLGIPMLYQREGSAWKETLL